jgi:2-hydroxychromene-2-carboxylate isomerase
LWRRKLALTTILQFFEIFPQEIARASVYGGMGELINLAERLADRSRPSRNTAGAFFFELGDPLSYLAAERVERAFGHIEWVPVARLDCAAGRGRAADEALLELARAEAAELRLPLLEPENYGAEQLAVARAASFAAERGECARFSVAASRLAFCGGYDLDDPEVIAEAADVARLNVDDALAAAFDPCRDVQLFATATGLAKRGITAAPAIRISSNWFDGVDAVAEASSLAAVRTLYG